MKSVFRQSLFLLLLALVPAGLGAWLHPETLPWHKVHVAGEVAMEELRQWKEPVLYLDARSRKAYERQHVPQALLLNEDDWENLLSAVIEAWTPDKRIVVYCGTETCQPSHAVAKRLKQELGVEGIYVLEGGYQAWQAGW